MIVFVLNSRRKFTMSMRRRESNNNENKKAARDRKFAINSIMLNVTCFILKMPLLITNIVMIYMEASPQLTQMVFTICVTIFIMDNSSPFFVNFIFNSLFYDEILVMCGLRKASKQSEIITTNRFTWLQHFLNGKHSKTVYLYFSLFSIYFNLFVVIFQIFSFLLFLLLDFQELFN